MGSRACIVLSIAVVLGCGRSQEPEGVDKTPIGVNGGGAAGEDAVATSPESQWKSAVYGWRNNKTGNCFLKVDEYVLQKGRKPRQFRVVGLWRYDAEEDRWNKVQFDFDPPVSLKPTGGTIYSAAHDETVMNLPHEIGLYWVVWREDGHRGAARLTRGPVLCNDLPLTAPPKGKVWACVPYPTSATATLVPDPEIHCRE